MSIDVDWTNPYRSRRGKWYKGNLHTHSAPDSKCGSIPTTDSLEMYAKAGYDFLCVSEHMILSSATHDHLTLIPGTEWNARGVGKHTGIYSMDLSIFEPAIALANQVQLLDFLSDKDALVVLNHPNWQLVPHYRREELYGYRHYDGIEIYNGVIERLPGAAIATDKWDALLFNGIRVLGFASDDSHMASDIGYGWISVRSPGESAKSILRAIRTGNFYCSSGVVLQDIRRKGCVITVESENAQHIEAIIDGGRRVAHTKDSAMTFDTAELDAMYVRFTAYGPATAMAWTQPFFLKQPQQE